MSRRPAKVTEADDADDALLSETQVLTRWPCLSIGGLRTARAAERIAWIRGKRGSAWYRHEAVNAYIANQLEKPCRAVETPQSSNSETSGSRTSPALPSSTDIGLSPELEEHVANHFAQKMFQRPQRSSRQ